MMQQGMGRLGLNGVLGSDKTSNTIKQALLQQQNALARQASAFRPQFQEVDTLGGGIGLGLTGLFGGLQARRQQNASLEQEQALMNAFQAEATRQAQRDADQQTATMNLLNGLGLGQNAINAVNAGIPVKEFAIPNIQSDVTLNQVQQRLNQIPVAPGQPVVNLGNIQTPEAINIGRAIMGNVPTTVQDVAKTNVGLKKDQNELAVQPVQLQQDITAQGLANQGAQIANAKSQIQLQYEDTLKQQEVALNRLAAQDRQQGITTRGEEFKMKTDAINQARGVMADPVAFGAVMADPRKRAAFEALLQLGGLNATTGTPDKATPIQVKPTVKDGKVTSVQKYNPTTGQYTIYDAKKGTSKVIDVGQ